MRGEDRGKRIPEKKDIKVKNAKRKLRKKKTEKLLAGKSPKNYTKK